jgi:hypothetical protein
MTATMSLEEKGFLGVKFKVFSKRFNNDSKG